jgi:RNA polymerase sigma factor for flagellar operon FliA
MQEVSGVDLNAQAQVRDKLVESSLEFADKMVWSVMRRYGLQVDYFDELRSAALYGLVEAAERYDPKRGGAFFAFAQLRVRGAIIDYMRSCFLVSGRAYKALQAQRKAQEIFEFQMDPLKKESGDPLRKIYDTASTMAVSYALSFDRMEDFPEQEERSTNPEEHLIKEQRMEMLLKALRKLPVRERNVIEQYYFRDRSLSEVVETKNKVSRSWLSRIHSRALRRLKKHITFMSAEFSSVKEEE